MIAYIGLGSNLGDSKNYLQTALSSLHAQKNVTLRAYSRFYGSKPHGPQNQPDYSNAVAKIDCSLSPLALLDTLQAIEQDNDRIRSKQRWSARTLDLDLLLYGMETLQTERLTIPHPYIQERPFVLYPLYDITPNLHFPNGDKLADYITGNMPDDLWILE
ncbi:MAG TPA: 2-amino-4-hydroxy-6-hydroxymethyldihydropteridine diphosphokinase [Thiothrix sp.]|nr:2-amino-4-hydroxy-6-hydroxymethyldihydropteridine diphosphokinase [Thiothrix sp.]